MENKIIDSLRAENENLKCKVEDLEFVNNNLVSRVVILERNYWQSAQYQRRNNCEIVGIPVDVSDDLEVKVCEIFKSIDVDICTDEIEACHRLPYSSKEDRSKPKRTIIKLVNRKKCELAILNRKRLKDVDKTKLEFPEDTRIFINDSLCPYYRGIYGKNAKSFTS